MCLSLFCLAWSALADKVLVGTHFKENEKGLYSVDLHKAGDLGEVHEIIDRLGTSIVIAKSNTSIIYTCGVGEKKGLIQAYDLKAQKLIGSYSSHDMRPCYLALSHDQKFLLVSNIRHGSVCSIRINDDGTLGALVSKVEVPPKAKRFAPHACVVSPDGDYVFVPDIAGNRLCRLKFDKLSGELKYLDSIASKSFNGPRHMSFDSEGKRAYLVNQMGETITVFTYAEGNLLEVDQVQTLPDDQLDINNHIAEIKIHPSGKFVYVSNRGHNSIALLQRDIKTGMIRFDRCFSSEGEMPWSFAISAKGDFLYCSNNKSNNLVSFKIDQESGHLTYTGKQVSVPNPSSVIYITD
ncbi:beta-propeller fold lactonase family protein [Lentisphaera profundi]|uniref:Beta-propeller fold lactonase family protein n=1 Tax=Lentisphaera profundi TaxID=1658616 RepID=A0ABY7VX68_9BACT|nr:beta-propeller fold lactonase family protein [Lentisphaera profundi]WDE98840.1 beta-propeller fold lactonase family protein [Lentisphaera profundi]